MKLKKLDWNRLSGVYCAGWFDMAATVEKFRVKGLWHFQVKDGDKLVAAGCGRTMDLSKKLAEEAFFNHFGKKGK